MDFLVDPTHHTDCCRELSCNISLVHALWSSVRSRARMGPFVRSLELRVVADHDLYEFLALLLTDLRRWTRLGILLLQPD